MRWTSSLTILGLFVAGVALPAQSPSTPKGQQTHAGHAAKPANMTNQQKIALAMSAAPADIARDATIAEPGENGQMKTLRAGTNGWVCMPAPEVMCLDKPWQAWAEAWMNKKPVQVKTVGVAYMLKGDTGVSNTDPYATTPTAANQWVQTGPHIMLLVPDPSQLEGLPTDPYKGGPFVMWKGTPYAHIMIPTEAMPKQEHAPATRR